MTCVNDIYKYIDGFAPFDSAEQWDNVGLLVGSGEAKVDKALLALDITNAVLDEAKSIGAQLVISHHPIIFSGLKRLPASSPVYKAANYGISCICAHTNLDRSPVFGVNTALSSAAGLTDCRCPDESELFFVARTPSPVTPEEFAQTLKERFGIGAVAYTSVGKSVSNVGLCSGGGGSEAMLSLKYGCDSFITGEMKHHELLEANEAGINTFILGHFGSEDIVIAPLIERLSREFPDVGFIKSRVFDDGVRFA